MSEFCLAYFAFFGTVCLLGTCFFPFGPTLFLCETIKLTIHKNIKAGDYRLGVVVVAALALQLSVEVVSAEMLQFHCVS